VFGPTECDSLRRGCRSFCLNIFKWVVAGGIFPKDENNKLLLLNHHLLWCNIYTLLGSSSSVCDDEHFVLKIHKLLLFDFVFGKYASCNHPLKNIQTWATL
jgi:hypothetical protein